MAACAWARASGAGLVCAWLALAPRLASGVRIMPSVTGGETAGTVAVAPAANRSAALAALGPAAGSVDCGFPTASAAIQELGRLNPGSELRDGCLRDPDGSGEMLGCKAGCTCGWSQQCYPKFLLLACSSGQGDHAATEQASTRINVGTCSTAMPVLYLTSALVFVLCLGCVVTVRMCIQLRDAGLAAEKTNDMLTVPRATVPPVVLPPGSSLRGPEPVRWPEGTPRGQQPSSPSALLHAG